MSEHDGAASLVRSDALLAVLSPDRIGMAARAYAAEKRDKQRDVLDRTNAAAFADGAEWAREQLTANAAGERPLPAGDKP